VIPNRRNGGCVCFHSVRGVGGVWETRSRSLGSSTDARPSRRSCNARHTQPAVAEWRSCWQLVLRVQIHCRTQTSLWGRRHTRWCRTIKSYSPAAVKVNVLWLRTLDMVGCVCSVLYTVSPSLLYCLVTLEQVVSEFGLPKLNVSVFFDRCVTLEPLVWAYLCSQKEDIPE